MKATKNPPNLLQQFEAAWLNANIKEANSKALKLLKTWGLDVGEMYDLDFVDGQWIPITPPKTQTYDPNHT